MEKRYFTIEEANQIIPALEEAFGRMVQMYTQIRSTYQGLKEAGFAPENDDFSLTPPGADADVINDRANLKLLIDALQEELTALQKAGCLIKGIEAGLIDWYAKKNGRDIFLCWKLGEKQVGYWHEIEAGYMGRRPVSELDKPN
jgi:hypothetical protein